MTKPGQRSEEYERRYLVNPLARWIVHSTGWNLSTATTWARVLVVIIIVALALWVYGAIGGEII